MNGLMRTYLSSAKNKDIKQTVVHFLCKPQRMYNAIFFILFKFSKLNYIHKIISAVNVIIAY